MKLTDFFIIGYIVASCIFLWWVGSVVRRNQSTAEKNKAQEEYLQNKAELVAMQKEAIRIRINAELRKAEWEEYEYRKANPEAFRPNQPNL